jgi:hypothetical protein
MHGTKKHIKIKENINKEGCEGNKDESITICS